MDTIAYITPIFLPVTQTFIYDEITEIKHHNVLALTLKRQNRSKFPYKNLYVAKSSIASVNEFYHVMKKQNVKLMHFQFGITANHLFGLKKISGLPMVVTFHGFDASSELKKPSVLSEYKTKVFPAADQIIAVSQKLKNNLINAGCPQDKITVLSNGIDLTKFSYKPRILNDKETVKILCIARLTEKKGLTYLIKAFSKVIQKHPNAELLMVGQGELKSKLEKQIAQLHLTSKVKMIDFIPYNDIPNIMHQYHIFCLPSVTSCKGDEEGLPTVLKEAQATGMPVISTYHSGIPELIKDGKNGFLVAEKNVDELADKLIYLINHPDIWECMGLLGRKYVEKHFSKSEQVKKLEEIYTTLIENKT